MAQIGEVLEFLNPNGGYAFSGEEYEGIQFIDCEPISKAEFEAGFAKYDKWKAEKDLETANHKAALLLKLGITAEEAKLLLS
jgi:hypothetical protein